MIPSLGRLIILSPLMNFTLAVAQIDPAPGNVRANIGKHVEFAERARERGADLVVFPELSLTGYSIKDLNWDLAINPAKEPAEFGALIAVSKTISILAGGVEESDAFRIFNTAFLFEDGSVRPVHRKVYPPTYGMFEEMRYFSRGDSVRAAESKVGKLGVLICEDLWHMSLPYVLALNGAQVIIGLAASPTRLAGSEEDLRISTANNENHKAYARLLSSYIVFCNRVGYEDGINFWGGSTIVSPLGELLCSARLFDEDLLVARIDENEVRRARQFSRHYLDDDPGLLMKELRRITE